VRYDDFSVSIRPNRPHLHGLTFSGHRSPRRTAFCAKALRTPAGRYSSDILLKEQRERSTIHHFYMKYQQLLIYKEPLRNNLAMLFFYNGLQEDNQPPRRTTLNGDICPVPAKHLPKAGLPLSPATTYREITYPLWQMPVTCQRWPGEKRNRDSPYGARNPAG